MAFFPISFRNSNMFISIFERAARFLSGTIKLKTPVETQAGSNVGSKSFSESPSAFASAAFFIFSGLNRASFWVMVTRWGRPSLNRISTGRIPAPVCWRTCTPPSRAGTTPSSASRNQVPMTGWPASFNSSRAVKMRSRASALSSVGFCTKTVSERFISRAIACMALSDKPSPSVKTARGFPSNRVVVKTSRV